MHSVLQRYLKYPQRILRFNLATLISLVFLLIGPTAVWAHPLGNFTVNRYSRFELRADQLDLLYIVDMAEIPTQQERNVIDSNDDGEISPSEEEAYREEQVARLKDN